MWQASNGKAKNRLGEVVESSTISFVAECYRLGEAPAFGTFVRVSTGEAHGAGAERRDLVAVVAYAATACIDPGRRPVARGRDEPSVEELYRHNPEIEALLRTQFTAAIVGFVENVGYPTGRGSVRQFLPPQPAPLHAFVYACSDAEVRAFCNAVDFLETLARVGGLAPQDELLAACLRAAVHCGMDDRFVVTAGRRLVTVCDNDVWRLNGILRRVRQ